MRFPNQPPIYELAPLEAVPRRRDTFYVPTHKLHPVDLEKMPGGKPTVALVETLCIGAMGPCIDTQRLCGAAWLIDLVVTQVAMP